MTAALQLGLADVAALARVRRSVVSMWRTRYATTDRSFPQSTARRQNREFFDSDDVVDWLESTGLGNNRDARFDAAAFGILHGTPGEAGASELHSAAVTALLCVAALDGRALPVDADELLDLADEIDPDDEFLFTEVEAAKARIADLAGYVRRLIDAAYTPALAAERLIADRMRQDQKSRDGTLSAVAREFVAELGIEIARQAGPLETMTFADLAPGGSDLLIDVVRRLPDASISSVAVPFGADPLTRSNLRRLYTQGIAVSRLASSDDEYELPAPAVVVAQYPRPGVTGATEILNEIDQLTLAFGPANRAVVVAPSSVLTGRLTGQAQRIRDDVVRRWVRAMVQLPAGASMSGSREQSTVWCLGHRGGAETNEDARVLIADLTNHRLDQVTAQALITDVTTILGDSRPGRTHRFSYGHPELTRVVVARANLIRPSPGLLPVGRGFDPLTNTQTLSDALLAPIPGLTPAPLMLGQRQDARLLTVAEALRAGDVVVRPGHRIAARDIGADIGRPVLGAEEVVEPTRIGTRRIDPLDAASYPALAFTEPGDVVFCTSPRPAAWVDHAGGSVVVHGARVLRCKGSRLVPAVIAADINRCPSHAKSFRGWTLRVVAPGQAALLAAEVQRYSAYRDEVLARLGAVDRLSEALIDGVADGALSLAAMEAVPAVSDEKE